MADIELVIKIDEELYNDIKSLPFTTFSEDIIKNGTPRPETGLWILSGGYWRCRECKEKALLTFDKSNGGCREYDQVKSKYCPNCGCRMMKEGE